MINDEISNHLKLLLPLFCSQFSYQPLLALHFLPVAVCSPARICRCQVFKHAAFSISSRNPMRICIIAEHVNASQTSLLPFYSLYVVTYSTFLANNLVCTHYFEWPGFHHAHALQKKLLTSHPTTRSPTCKLICPCCLQRG